MKDIKVVAETTTTFSTFEKGDWIWFDPGYGYPMPGEVMDINSETRAAVVRSSISKNDIFTIANFSHLQRRTNDIQNVEDLIQLEELSDASILWCLKTRYDRNKIYTYIGGILISVNPYRMFDMYGMDTVKKYRNQVLGTLPAHLFALGDATYSDMLSSKSNQVIVMSGESGSGKTETCKILMQYLALSVSSEQQKNEPGRRNVTTEQILDATPILESFGNARTIRNDNSSRFGKYTEILFKNRRINGAEITEYLLEKSRIVSHNLGERNYHIFYELLSGLRPETKEKFGLSTADKFFYLNQGKCLQIPGRSDQESFQRLQAALEVLNFSSDQQHSIFRILAAILHLGNVYFNRLPVQASNNAEGVSIGNESEVNWCAYLLQLDRIQLTQALTVKFTETRDEKLATPLNIDRALDVRDALSKALYMHLFSWLISQINRTIYKTDRDSSIALLDIYGFENFKNNKFEQMCINFANERLHTYFLSNVFRVEQSEYLKEKIVWNENVGAQLDNQPVIDLLTKRPHGLFHLLDDESCFPKGTDETFLQKCHYNHIENPFYGKPRMHNPDFCVRHFAGPVWYDVPGFLDKNRDVLKGNLVDLLVESQNPMISQMFKQWKCGNVNGNGSMERTLPAKPRSATVVAGFNENLNNLMQKMNKSNPHFVRCLKPNLEKFSDNFDMQLVLDQLKCLGVLDTVRIRRLGYPIRYRFSEFVDKYQCLIPKREFIGKTEKLSCQHILTEQAFQFEDQYQIGVTKIFVKDGLSEYLDKSRDRRLQFAATLIQKNVKAYLHKKKYKRMKKATIKLQSCLRGWRARNRFSEMKSDLFRDAEQEAKHSRQLQMYEKMRNVAIKIDEKTSRNHAITGVNHLEIPADLSFNLNTMEEWDVINRQERVVRSSGDVTLFDRHLTVPHDLHNFPFAKFAQTFFKGHLWQMRREPITTPFLPKDNDDDFKDSLMIFKLILRYMNDINLSPTQEAMLANYIVQKGISNEILRDEIYCQLVNQTHGNANPANQERGWWLLGLCASAFPPSAGLFKFLLNYIMNGDCEHYRGLIHKKLLQSIHSDAATNRRYPPCLLEHKTVQQKGKMALDGRLADDSKQKCQVEAWTTANEFAGLVLKQKGVHDARGWSVSFDSPDVEIQLNGSDYLLDVLSYYELPRDFPALKSEYIIWAKPMTAEKRDAKLQKLTQFNEPPKDSSGAKTNGNQSSHDKKLLDTYPTIIENLEGKNKGNREQKQVHKNGHENNVQPRNLHEVNSNKPKEMEDKEKFKQMPKQNQNVQPPMADFTPVKHMKQTQSSIASHRLPNEVPDAVLPSGARSSIMTDFNDPLYARTRVLPSEYSVRSMASHVRNVAIPSKNSDVDKFLDDLFEPVLHDTTLEDLYEANSLAASIKGGGDSFGQQQGVATSNNFGQQSQVPGFSLVPTMNQPMVMMVPMDAMRMFNMQNMSNGLMAAGIANQANGMDYSSMNRNFSNQNNNMPTFMAANQLAGISQLQAGQFAAMSPMQAQQFSTMSPMQGAQFATLNQMQNGQFAAIGQGMSPMSPSSMSQMSFIPMQMPSMYPMNMANNGMMGNNGFTMNLQSMQLAPIITY